MRPGSLLFTSESISEGHPESRPAMPGAARCRSWSTRKGMGTLPDEQLETMARDAYRLTPQGIIDTLDLRGPIYGSTASNGHFGRDHLNLSWEQTSGIGDECTGPTKSETASRILKAGARLGSHDRTQSHLSLLAVLGRLDWFMPARDLDRDEFHQERSRLCGCSSS